nr:reverse transcriptase domain-containing protein [Tanacetum cinerariifolium]
MSSPNHPTSDIEDAFSSNSPDYISASSNYFLTSPGNTSSDSSVNSSGLIPIASPTPLLSNDDPYIKDFFVPEELLPPKKQICFLSSSTTDSSDLPQNQAYNLAIPSFLVHTPTPPKIFEIRKSSIKMHLRHHEKQIKDILNYLEEISFYRLEKVRSYISELQKKHLGQKEKIAFARFKISNLEQALMDIQASPAMTQAAIRQLIADGIAAALEAQATNMASTNNLNRNTKLKETPVARKCTYKEFMCCQPFYFNEITQCNNHLDIQGRRSLAIVSSSVSTNGTEGAVGLIRWFERNELVFSRSNCTEDCKVKFATGTLTDDALSWWNAYVQPIGIEQADKITWTELKRLLTNKYCPQTEVKKLEDEFYNLVVKGNDLKTYIRRF